MAWTTPRTWVDGELVTAALMNTHVRDNLNMTWRVLAYKTADETVNNSAALQNDDHLSFTVAANEIWICKFILSYTGGTTPDIKFAWTWPAGATAVFSTAYTDAAAVTQMKTTATSGTAIDITGSTTEAIVVFDGDVRIGATPGTLQLQWAQNTANVSNTVVKQGSCVLGLKLA